LASAHNAIAFECSGSGSPYAWPVLVWHVHVWKLGLYENSLRGRSGLYEVLVQGQGVAWQLPSARTLGLDVDDLRARSKGRLVVAAELDT
jgi:hypothetical protein